MLRILPERSADDTVVLRLEGQVRGRWVDELCRSCDDVLGASQRLVLDLAEVSFIDPTGLALFRDLAARQIELRNCSPFTAEQLKTMEAR